MTGARNCPTLSKYLNVPTLVQVAAMAIILIRGLDVLMIMNTLGIRGMGEFIHRSV
ncbi:DUF2593 family protein, partial [Salmonella enterica subsp. enterica serovar Montevideo]|nr:DUF2593 family protein [Salmonella enterica subsp. enterica serovar Montevideo]